MDSSSSRYRRQTILPEVGDAGQARLKAASVLVVGAGGLGSPVLQYLTGAGIGHLVVMDPDRVALDNLHRQPLFSERDAGRSKAAVAAQCCYDLNREVRVSDLDEALTPLNAAERIASVDIVMDCADNFAVSYILSDACFASGKPMISASVAGGSGYVGGYCGGAPSLRAVFPDLPETLASCATTGVLGPVVGMIGCLQAQMVLSVLLETDPSPLGQLVQFDAARFRSAAFRFDDSPEPETVWKFIACSEIRETDYVVELRDETEAPIPAAPSAHRIAVATFAEDSPRIPESQRVVMCCLSGLRSWQAAALLSKQWPGEIVLCAAGPSQ